MFDIAQNQTIWDQNTHKNKTTMTAAGFYDFYL